MRRKSDNDQYICVFSTTALDLMKHIISILIAAVLILAAYLYQFGLPAFLSSSDVLTPQNSTSQGQKSSASNAPSADPSARNAKRSSAPGRRRRGAEATFVTLADVEVEPYEDSYSSIGTGVAQQSVTLVSEVSGQIKEVLFDGTSRVSKGDELIKLEDESQRINVEIAQAQLSKALDSLERYQSLQKRNKDVVSEVTMKEAESAVAVAQGNLALARKSLADRTIKSPINGRLGLAEIEVGDFLSSGKEIVNINNTKTILVTFELPERAVNILALNKEIRASTPSTQGKVFAGKIVAFDSQIDDVTRTVTVKAAINNDDGLLWPGMTFTVRLVEESKAMPSIPSLSLTWTRDGTFVWIAEKGKVKTVPVIIRNRQDDTIWVSGDLKQGMKVVVDGVHKLRPGASIAVAGRTGQQETKAPTNEPESTQRSTNQEKAQ